jgi:hypothetical protein
MHLLAPPFLPSFHLNLQEMIRNLTLLFVSLFFACLAFAQNASSDFKNAVKLNNVSSYTYNAARDLNGNRIGGNSFRMFELHPGILKRGPKGDFWDISLQNINFSINSRTTTTIQPSRAYNVGLSVKVGYFYAFAKQKTNHWVPMLGLEVVPFASASRSRPFISAPTITPSPYFVAYKSAGAQAFLTPRIMWCPGKRFFMDASLNLNLVQVGYNHRVSDDPADVFVRRSSLNVDLWGERRARLTVGFGLKL